MPLLTFAVNVRKLAYVARKDKNVTKLMFTWTYELKLLPNVSLI